MEKRKITIKVWQTTRLNLKKLSAILDKPMVQIMDDLVTKLLNKEEGRDGKR